MSVEFFEEPSAYLGRGTVWLAPAEGWQIAKGGALGGLLGPRTRRPADSTRTLTNVLGSGKCDRLGSGTSAAHLDPTRRDRRLLVGWSNAMPAGCGRRSGRHLSACRHRGVRSRSSSLTPSPRGVTSGPAHEHKLEMHSGQDEAKEGKTKV